jgi:hypothetical protein
VGRVLLRFGGILFIVMLAVWLYCLLDAITSDETQVRSLPKVLWVLIVLFTFEIGAVLWLLLGRPRKADRPARGARPPGRKGRGDAWSGWPRPPAGPAGQRDRPAPDDDPEFLAGLDGPVNDEHEQLLGRWEADLRRREEELRRKDDGEDDKSRPDDQTR